MVLVQGLSLPPARSKRPFWIATDDKTELRASMVTIRPLTRRTSRESAQLSAAIATAAAASTKRNDFTCSYDLLRRRGVSGVALHRFAVNFKRRYVGPTAGA